MRAQPTDTKKPRSQNPTVAKKSAGKTQASRNPIAGHTLELAKRIPKRPHRSLWKKLSQEDNNYVISTTFPALLPILVALQGIFLGLPILLKERVVRGQYLPTQICLHGSAWAGIYPLLTVPVAYFGRFQGWCQPLGAVPGESAGGEPA
jgi:hypothetical protein